MIFRGGIKKIENIKFYFYLMSFAIAFWWIMNFIFLNKRNEKLSFIFLNKDHWEVKSMIIIAEKMERFKQNLGDHADQLLIYKAYILNSIYYCQIQSLKNRKLKKSKRNSFVHIKSAWTSVILLNGWKLFELMLKKLIRMFF
jgi:hypothetical protein